MLNLMQNVVTASENSVTASARVLYQILRAPWWYVAAALFLACVYAGIYLGVSRDETAYVVLGMEAAALFAAPIIAPFLVIALLLAFSLLLHEVVAVRVAAAMIKKLYP